MKAKSKPQIPAALEDWPTFLKFEPRNFPAHWNLSELSLKKSSASGSKGTEDLKLLQPDHSSPAPQPPSEALPSQAQEPSKGPGES